MKIQSLFLCLAAGLVPAKAAAVASVAPAAPVSRFAGLQDPEPGATSLAELRAAFEAARELQADGDLARAQAAADSTLEFAVERFPAEPDEGWLELCADLGRLAHELGRHAGAERIRRAVLEHLERSVAPEHPARLEAALELGRSLFARGDFGAAETLIAQVVAIRERSAHPDDPDLAVARRALALTLRRRGRFREAVPLERLVFETRERTLPADHPDLLRAGMNLSGSLQMTGDLEGARILCERVLAGYERSFPEDHPELADARQNLAVVVRELGDLQQARQLEERVLEARRRTLAEEDPKRISAKGNLAVTLRELGDLAGALELEERSLAILERTQPPDHPQLLRTRLNHANTRMLSGDLEGARTLYEMVLEAFERSVQEDHPHLLTARLNLASALDRLGDIQGARVLREAVLASYQRTLPEDHPSLVSAREGLASTLKKLGDLPGARVLQEGVLAARERSLPGDHPHLLLARMNLAGTMRELGDLQGARELGEAVLVAVERTLPGDHPYLLRAQQGLAATLGELGDLYGARRLEEAVLVTRQRTLPEEHPDRIRAREYLALTMRKLGDLQGARADLEAVLEARERTLPDDHPDLLQARGNLASLVRELGDLHGARVLQEKVLKAYERTVPEDHPHLLIARGNLANTIFMLGDLRGARALEEAVLAAGERALPEGHPRRFMALGNLAETMKQLGDLEGAWALEEAVLAGFEHIFPGNHPLLLAAQGNLAVTGARLASAARGSMEEGQESSWPRALTLAQGALRGAARGVQSALLGSSPREAEERVARVTERPLGQALSFALGFGLFEASKELAAEAFGLSEAGRGAGLAAARFARAARGSAEFATLRDEVREASAELAALAQEGASVEAFHRARTRREVAERGLVRLAEARLGEGFTGLTVDEPALSARLGAAEGLVAFRRYTRWWLEEVEGGAGSAQPEVEQRSRRSLGAFVLARNDIGTEPRLAFVDLGPIEAIEGAVREWRAVIGVGTAGQVRSGSGQESGPRGIGLEAIATSDGSAEARVLRRLVWDPLVSALGAAERVSVGLDDVLHLVPLEALLLEEEERLLGERWRIETRTSFWELLVEDPPVDPSGAFLALGDVAYDAEPVAWSEDQRQLEADGETHLLAQSSGATRPLHHAGGYGGVLRGSPSDGGFTSLAHTGGEVRTIAALLRASTGSDAQAWVLEGPRASLANLELLAPRTRWLHLATHGWFAPDRIRSLADRDGGADSSRSALGLRYGAEEAAGGMSPLLLCGLALAGANLAPDFLGRVPGLLTAEELSGLDLTSCELAVLSACDTNVGRLSRAGQGVASLQKALHMAGARSVITSLWKVDDAATAKFFERFYTLLWQEHLPKSEALWRTKLELRAAGHPPRDWAAWVLTGDPN